MPRNEIRTKNFEEIRVIDINRPILFYYENRTQGTLKQLKRTKNKVQPVKI